VGFPFRGWSTLAVHLAARAARQRRKGHHRCARWFVWIATGNGLSHMVNGQFHNYTTADGLYSNRLLVFTRIARRHLGGTSRGINRMTAIALHPCCQSTRLDPRYISLAEDSSGELYALSAPKGIDHMNEINCRGQSRPRSAQHGDFPSGSLVHWNDGIFRFSEAAFRQKQVGQETTPDYACMARPMAWPRHNAALAPPIWL